MRTTSATNSHKRGGPSANTVGVGLAGAVAGAAVGVALADDKTRHKMYKLAKDARTSVMNLVDSIEVPETDLPEKAKKIGKKYQNTIKEMKK